MNPIPISILLYERDARVMQTLQWALQSRGYRVLSASHVDHFDSIPLTPPIDLLVLGHSIPAKEAASVSAQATSRWPRIKRLALVHENTSVPDGAIAERVSSMDSPMRVLSTVSELVGYAGSSSYSHIY